MGAYASIVHQIVQEFGYGEVDVAGESWGGALAHQYTQRYPGTVGKLILAATLHEFVVVPQPPSSAVRDLLLEPDRSEAFLEAHGAALLGGDMRDPELRAQYAPLLAREVNEASKAAQIEAGKGWLCNMTRLFDITRYWLLTKPTLLMAGDDDPLIPVINNRAMQWLPNVTYHEVKGGGHLFLHTRPELAEVINDFRKSSNTR